MLVVVALPSVASAASRVVFQLADPTVEVFLDQDAVRPMGPPDKRTANHVTPGAHTVLIQRNGQVLSRNNLQVPDGATVMVQVGTTGALQVSGATATSAAAPPSSGGARPAAPPPSSSGKPGAGASALGAAERSDSLASEGTAGSFDMNEGDGHAGVQAEDGPAGGDFSTFSRTAGTAGRVVGGAVMPGVGGAVVGSVAPAAAYGAASMVKNAESGGISALSGGSTFRQGRPIPKKADTGTVAFTCPTSDPIVVFLEGFVIAQVGPGSQKAKAKLEVGRHKLEFMDAETGQYIYRGVVQIDKDETVTLEIGDAQPPKALDRSWAWSLR